MESTEEANKALIEKVMGELENFWMNDSDQGGEALFNNFIKDHADKFKDGFDTPELMDDNPVEYTNIFMEYRGIAEKKVESIIVECGYTTD